MCPIPLMGRLPLAHEAIRHLTAMRDIGRVPPRRPPEMAQVGGGPAGAGSF
jgi:hypothetical protein